MGSIEPRIRIIGYAASALQLSLPCPGVSRADEAGASFWLPGQYASLAAVPQTPGWALTASYYHVQRCRSRATLPRREKSGPAEFR